MLALEDFTVIRAPIERCFDLARSVEVHLAGNVHWGESACAVAGVTSGLLAPGQQVTWSARHFAVRLSLTSRITAMDRPAYFQDVMLRGPFRSMRHEHHFRPLDAGRTEMHDRFFVEAPWGALGRVAEILVLRRYMGALLRERNGVIREIAESSRWRRYLPPGADGKWLE